MRSVPTFVEIKGQEVKVMIHLIKRGPRMELIIGSVLT